MGRAFAFIASLWLLCSWANPAGAQVDTQTGAERDAWQSEMNAAKSSIAKKLPAEAYQHYGKALDASRDFKSDDPRLLKTFMAMAQFNYSARDNFAEADNFYSKALAFAEAQPKLSQIEMARIIFPLIMTYVMEEKYNDAKELFEKGKAVDDELLTSKAPGAASAVIETSKVLNSLAMCYLSKHQHAQGELVLNEAVRLVPNYQVAYANRAAARRSLANHKGADEDEKKAGELKQEAGN
jgi:hypothetical protein